MSLFRDLPARALVGIQPLRVSALSHFLSFLRDLLVDNSDLKVQHREQHPQAICENLHSLIPEAKPEDL